MLARLLYHGITYTNCNTKMLVTKAYQDIPVRFSPNGAPMRVFIISPKIDGYPNAKFPGVVVFSEIYQVTGPVERFASQIASQGYIIGKYALSGMGVIDPGH